MDVAVAVAVAAAVDVAVAVAVAAAVDVAVAGLGLQACSVVAWCDMPRFRCMLTMLC